MDQTGLATAPGDACDPSPRDALCTVCELFGTFGRKWTLHLVGHLRTEGPVRFNELRRQVGSISPRTLSDRLSELEGMDLVERIDHGTIPPKVEYTLTEKGEALDEVLRSFVDWAGQWAHQATTDHQALDEVSEGLRSGDH